MSEAIEEVVRCRRIEVVDSDGAVRFLVHCDQDGADDSVYVELLTPKASGSLVLYADEEGAGVQGWARQNVAAQGRVSLDGRVTAAVRPYDGDPAWEFDSEAAVG